MTQTCEQLRLFDKETMQKIAVPKRIYLASPFFTCDQVDKVKRAEEILRGRGLDVFSPREHQFEDLPFGSKEWREATFCNDIDHIEWADLLVAIYDDEDSGTMFEVGYAYAIEKPVVLVNIGEKQVNLMLTDTWAYLTSWKELEEYDFDKMPIMEFEGRVF